ncbi:helix-turn-helix domain-containing protein [Ameyamaea chiangmaiensis]|uniref:helix-turn-helix domain-containing protein n=1 Tax=Ameyamaea chiangmaiensis TaxID=442969 RepID=UPI0038D20A12
MNAPSATLTLERAPPSEARILPVQPGSTISVVSWAMVPAARLSSTAFTALVRSLGTHDSDADDASAEHGADQRPLWVGATTHAVERALILDTLAHTDGNRTHAASLLGISIRSLRNKLRDYAALGAAIPPPASGAP